MSVANIGTAWGAGTAIADLNFNAPTSLPSNYTYSTTNTPTITTFQEVSCVNVSSGGGSTVPSTWSATNATAPSGGKRWLAFQPAVDCRVTLKVGKANDSRTFYLLDKDHNSTSSSVSSYNPSAKNVWEESWSVSLTSGTWYAITNAGSNGYIASMQFVANPTFSESAGAELAQNEGTVTLTASGTTIYYKWSTSSSAYSADAGSSLVSAADGNGTSPKTVTAPDGTGTYYLYAVAKRGNYYSDVVKRSYTIVAPAPATTCADAYSFHYGPNGGSWETPICFTQVGETHEWNIENFTIPSHANGEFWVGYAGATNGQSVTKRWTDGLSDTGSGIMNGAMVLLPTNGSIVGQATGATGTLSIWDNSSSKNQYVGFKPDGYAIMYGGNNYAFSETATSNVWETDLLTLPDVSTTYQVGIKTASSYTTCSHSRAAEALSAPGNTMVKDGKKMIYINPGVWKNPGENDQKLGIWDATTGSWGNGGNFLTYNSTTSQYEGYVPETTTTIVLARMDKGRESLGGSWGTVYNQTKNITLNLIDNEFSITGWGNDDGKSGYSQAPHSHPATGDNGKFRMYDNSNDLNWYAHWIPYYKLSYDGNGGTGSVAAQYRNSELSTSPLSVAGNGFTRDGWRFAGWNTNKYGTGTDYAPGDNIDITGDQTLYAKWERDIYLQSDVSWWYNDNAWFAVYCFDSEHDTNYKWVSMTRAEECSSPAVYKVALPGNNFDKVIFVRMNKNKASLEWASKDNQTTDITYPDLAEDEDLFTITNGDNGNACTGTWGTYSVPTFTITFAGNSNTGGSMSDISSIACDAEQAITANAFTKTGYSFAGWKANVNVTIDDDEVSAGTVIDDEETIQNIRSNITLTAQWSVRSYDLTWNLGGGTTTSAGTGIASGVSANTTSSIAYGTSLSAPTVTKTGYNFSAWSPSVASTMPAAVTTYTATWTAKTTTITIDDNDENHGSTTPGTVTATYGSALPSFTAAAGESGYSLTGYFTAATEGDKIINADGTLVRNTTYSTDESTPKWKSEAATLTLFAQYEEEVVSPSKCITFNSTSAPSVSGVTIKKVAGSDGGSTYTENGFFMSKSGDYITFDISALGNLTKATFTAKTNSTSKKIGYGYTDNTTTIGEVPGGDGTADKDFHEYEITGIPGNTTRFTIIRKGTGTTITEVCLFYTPISCSTPAAPTSPTNGATTTNTQVVTWTANDEDTWEVYHSTSSSTPGTDQTPTATVTSATYTFTGLTASTQYYWWARSKCDASHKSSWVAGTSFTTSAATYTLTATAVQNMTGTFSGSTTISNSPVSSVTAGTTIATSSNTFTVGGSTTVAAPETIAGTVEVDDGGTPYNAPCTWRFSKWNNIVTPVAGDESDIEAEYVPTFAINYTLDGGTINEDYPTYYIFTDNEEDEISLPTNVTKANYTFDHWVDAWSNTRSKITCDYWGDFNLTAVWTAKTSPGSGTVSGTTSICSGDNTDITLSASVSGASYQLYKGEDKVGDAKAGTGSALTWSVSAAGTYTVKAVETATHASGDMSGSAVISASTATSISTQPTTAVSGHDGVDFTLGSDLAATGEGTLTYQWYSYTSSDGAGQATIGSATTTKTLTTSKAAGTYYYKVGVIGACDEVKSNMITVTIDNEHLLTYDAGSGSGAPSGNWKSPGSMTLPADLPTRSGYIFLGWNTKNDGTGDMYQPSGSFTMPSSATTLYAAWASPCFTITDAARSSTWSDKASGATIESSDLDGTITGGTVINSGSATMTANDTRGMVFNSNDREITITLTNGMFQEGTVIAIGGKTNNSNSTAYGFAVSGNATTPATYTTTAADYQDFTVRYVVTADDGIEGTSSFALKRANSNQVYLKTIYIGGCMSCTGITPTLTYSKTTIWMDDADLTATPNLNKDGSTGSATYVSNNTDVATVDPSTGVVTAVARGTATIIATIAADGTHCDKSATCDITVKDINCGITTIAKATRSGTSASYSGVEGGSALVNNLDGSNYKLKSEGYVGVQLPSTLSFEAGDIVRIDLTIGDWWNGASADVLPVVVYADNTGTNEIYRTDNYTKQTAQVVEFEVTSSMLTALASKQVTVYRKSSTETQNHVVNSVEVKRYSCPDSKEFLPTGDDGNWNATANWIGATGRGASLPTIDDRVIISKPVTVDIADAKAKDVLVNQYSGATGKVTVSAGKALIIADKLQKTTTGSDRIATAAADVIINSTRAAGGGALIIGGETGTNKATVNFETKVKRESGTGNWINQYVGSPFSDNTPYVDYALQLYKFCPKANGDRTWWATVHEGDAMTPFWGYDVLYNDNNYLDVTWTGTLNASTTKTINGTDLYYNGSSATDNMFANSWTAPIHVGEIEDSDVSGIEKTFYLFNAGTPQQDDNSSINNTNTDAGTYVSMPIHSAEYAGIGVIPAMQGFYVVATGASPSLTLNYSKVVYTPALTAVGIQPNRAPKRDAEVAPEVIKLHVQSETGWAANTYVMGRKDFAEGYEDGWDGAYIEGESATPKLYTPSIDGDMFINCLPQIDGTVVGFRKGSDDSAYTFSFKYDGEDEYYLKDLKLDIETRIDNDHTYFFTTEDGDSATRFIIVRKTPAVATGSDNVDAEAAQARKLIIDNKVYIIRGGRMYDATGRMVK